MVNHHCPWLWLLEPFSRPSGRERKLLASQLLGLGLIWPRNSWFLYADLTNKMWVWVSSVNLETMDSMDTPVTAGVYQLVFSRRWHLAAEGFLVDAPGNQYGDGYFEGSMDDVVGLYIYILGYALCEWWSFDNNLHNQTFLPRKMRGNIVMSSVMEADDNNYCSRRLGGNQVG